MNCSAKSNVQLFNLFLCSEQNIEIKIFQLDIWYTSTDIWRTKIILWGYNTTQLGILLQSEIILNCWCIMNPKNLTGVTMDVKSNLRYKYFQVLGRGAQPYNNTKSRFWYCLLVIVELFTRSTLICACHFCCFPKGRTIETQGLEDEQVWIPT